MKTPNCFAFMPLMNAIELSNLSNILFSTKPTEEDERNLYLNLFV